MARNGSKKGFKLLPLKGNVTLKIKHYDGCAKYDRAFFSNTRLSGKFTAVIENTSGGGRSLLISNRDLPISGSYIYKKPKPEDMNFEAEKGEGVVSAFDVEIIEIYD